MNKVLCIVLVLLLLNLVREYTMVRPKDASGISVPHSYRMDFGKTGKKKWAYYKEVFIRHTAAVGPEKVDKPLPLILCGVVIGGVPDSFAVIEDLSSGRQDLYRLGDTVEGARITAMDRGSVTLKRNGAKYSLRMRDADKVRGMHKRGGILPKTIPGKKHPVDFAKIFSQIRIKPYFEGGKCAGFQIGNINSNFIKRIGLKEGDIVESINGVELDDPLKAVEILYSIEKNNPVHMGIERKKEKMELDCVIEG